MADMQCLDSMKRDLQAIQALFDLHNHSRIEQLKDKCGRQGNFA
jgi:hypothetical protein